MSKKKNQSSQNKGIFAQWGVTIAILVIIVIFLVSKFSVVSESNATKTIYSTLNTELATTAVLVGAEFNEVTDTTEGVAATISVAKAIDELSFGDIAKSLKETSPYINCVAIVDNEGKGVLSSGSEVSISNGGYLSDSENTRCMYVENDAITGSKSFVVTVPFHSESAGDGYVCSYIDANGLFAEYTNKNSFGGNCSYGLIDKSGDIVATGGVSNFFTNGDNLFVNLSSATLPELSVTQIKLRVERHNKMTFAASKGSENKVLVITPIGVDDWQMITVIDQQYVNVQKRTIMKEAHGLIIGLSITLCVFAVILVVVVLINRLRYNEESKALATKADTDLLTGLNNKIATERKIQEYIDENPESQCMMFLFDIDNFKKINDTMGHAFGDEVLSSLGHQLTNEFRMTDIIGRLGGDEFVLFLKNIKSDEQLEKEGVRITNFFHQFRAGDYVKYSATASIGAVVVPRDANSFEAAYKAADKALYEAKRRGKNQLVVYSNDLANVESVRATDDIDTDDK